jgi:hypothetical protein
MRITVFALMLLLLAACLPQPVAAPEETAVPPATRGHEPAPLAPAATVTPEPAPAGPAEDEAQLKEVRPSIELINPPPILSQDHYPPADIPYFVVNGDFWLVHATDGRLFAFAPLAPAYEGQPGMEPCRYTWVESDGRFVDPCSGNKWELTGALDVEHSTERWRDRDLDQFLVRIQESQIFVQLTEPVPGLPAGPGSMLSAGQYGVTMTVRAAEFDDAATIFRMLVQVDAAWQMDPAAFPPQQTLLYPTFPHSLFDDRGHEFTIVSGGAGFAVAETRTTGMRSNAYVRWPAVAGDAGAVTATLTLHLSQLYRHVTLPLDWDGREPGDEWDVDFPLEIGFAAARVRQVSWAGTTRDGLAHLQLAVEDESPADIRLYCLHLELEDPWQRTCANFNGQKTYPIYVRPGEPVDLHLRAALEFANPFELVVAVSRDE